MKTLFRYLLAPMLGVLAIVADPLRAEDGMPVVVELFTSQGCASCPPADKLLHELSDREDVIALALHVDYWDYIGWKDKFAHPAHTERQKTYAKVAGRRSIYTPQLIVNGQDSIIGARAMDLAETIQAHEGRDTGVELDLDRKGDVLHVKASNRSDRRDLVLHMLRYIPESAVSITRGENAGRDMHYTNIVQDWQILAKWTGGEDLSIETPISGDRPVVVLVQTVRQGPILAAARLP